jgi:hypothetical protein
MAMFWGPLSQAIVFGLSFATVLTLIVTPAMLALPQRLRRILPTRIVVPPAEQHQLATKTAQA